MFRDLGPADRVCRVGFLGGGVPWRTPTTPLGAYTALYVVPRAMPDAFTLPLSISLHIDARSGVVLRTGLQQPERDIDIAASGLLEAFERYRVLPASVTVRSAELAGLLAPTIQALDVGLEIAERLPNLDAVRRSMERSLPSARRRRRR